MNDKTGKSNTPHVTVWTLALMTVAAVVSLRGLPMMAAEGLSMVFYILFASVVFLLPAALVSAELGSTFATTQGGVYTWVSAAFGPRLGVTAIWLQWIQNVVWYPTVLGYAAASLAYFFMDSSLASSGFYTGIMIIGIYWLATFVALSGSSKVNMVTKYGVILGTLLPGLLIIVLGILWVDQGNPIAFLASETVEVGGHMVSEKAHARFFPHMTGLGSIAFLAGIVLLFAGVEVQAVQVMDMKNPQRQFPMGMLLASAIIILLFLAGSFAVAAVLPAREISLTAGLMQAFQMLFKHFNMEFLTPIIGLLMAFGAIGGVMSWVTGPSRGLLQTANEGEIPPLLARVNKQGSPVSLLIIQGLLVTVLSSPYFLMADVSVAFFVLSAMTATLYLAMYMLMFAAAIYLRTTKPDLPRPFKVPGGLVGMWLIGGIGFLGVSFALVVGFFPPTNLPVGNPALYVGLVAAGMVVFIGMPLIIQAMKKPSWKSDVAAMRAQMEREAAADTSRVAAAAAVVQSTSSTNPSQA